MRPDEAEISAAIDDLGPAEFERLVGRWIAAAPEFDGRFSGGLQIRGRKGAQTVRGFPDAYVEDSDGRWDCVEATHSERWNHEFEAKLENVRKLGRGRVSGFVLVAWSHGPRDQATVNRAREELIGAGVPKASIDFVFRGHLLMSMRDRRFAHLWSEELGLAFSPQPFRQMDVARGLFRADGERSVALRPRAEEFRSGKVHRPLVLDAVAKQLDEVGISEVRGRGAAGKTVLAEHVAYWHLGRKAPRVRYETIAEGAAEDELVSTGPVYYLKLGSFEGRSGPGLAPAEAFSLLAAPNALFLVDDVHLDPLAAEDLLHAWRDRANGSKLLLLGRELEVLAERPAQREDDRPPVLELQVGAEDLIGVYRRLAQLAGGDQEPAMPPNSVVREWLELFRGDLVVFGAAVVAKLRRLRRGEWELSETDAALEVEQRYLRDLESEERRDLLGLAALSRYELGAPATGVRSGLQRSQETGAVLRIQIGLGDPGEFQLAHPGLGKLMLAADAGRSEARDPNEWASADAAFGLRLGVGRWEAGEGTAAAETWKRVLDSPELGLGLAGVSTTVGRPAIAGFGALGLCTPEELDRRLLGEVDAIFAALLDRPGQIGPILRCLEVSCPDTSARLRAALVEDAAVDVLLDDLARKEPGMSAFRLGSWIRPEPQIAEALARRLSDPEVLTRFLRRSGDLAGFFGNRAMGSTLRQSPAFAESFDKVMTGTAGLAEEVAGRVLEGDLLNTPRADRLLGALSPTLRPYLHRLALGDDLKERVAAFAEDVEPTFLVGLLRYAASVNQSLLETAEAAVSPEHRQRLAKRFVREKEALRGLYKLRGVSPLAVVLVAEAKELGADLAASAERGGQGKRSRWASWSLNWDPSSALVLDPGLALGFVTSEGGSPPDAVKAVVDVLRSAENRERLVRSLALQPPATLQAFLVWAAEAAPELREALLTHLEGDANLSAYADVCVDRGAPFEHLSGLLELLAGEDPELAERFAGHLIAPSRLPRLTEVGLRGPPAQWVALLSLGREELARAVLAELDESRWSRYWQTCPLGGVDWLRNLQVRLLAIDRPELCAAPTERVLATSTPEHWQAENVALRHLAGALNHDVSPGGDLALRFLDRIDHVACLERNYRDASLWAIAHFIGTLTRWQTEEVVDAVITPAIAERVAVELENGWDGESAGLLALIGSLRLAGIPTFIEPPVASRTVAALGSVTSLDGQLTFGHVLVWTGLRSLVREVGQPLDLGAAEVLAEHLRLFEEAQPDDCGSREINRSLADWIGRAIHEGGILRP